MAKVITALAVLQNAEELKSVQDTGDAMGPLETAYVSLDGLEPTALRVFC